MRAVLSQAARSAKRARVFAITRGFWGKRKNCYKIAKRAAKKALEDATIGRKLKKRDMRKLWIQRVNAGAREHGVTYSKFMHGLVRSDVALNRKVLSELAMHEPHTFRALAELAKKEWVAANTGLKQLVPQKDYKERLVKKPNP